MKNAMTQMIMKQQCTYHKFFFILWKLYWMKLKLLEIKPC